MSLSVVAGRAPPSGKAGHRLHLRVRARQGSTHRLLVSCHAFAVHFLPEHYLGSRVPRPESRTRSPASATRRPAPPVRHPPSGAPPPAPRVPRPALGFLYPASLVWRLASRGPRPARHRPNRRLPAARRYHVHTTSTHAVSTPSARGRNRHATGHLGRDQPANGHVGRDRPRTGTSERRPSDRRRRERPSRDRAHPHGQSRGRPFWCRARTRRATAAPFRSLRQPCPGG